MPHSLEVKLIGSWRRVLILFVSLIVIGIGSWWFLLRMPGKKVTSAAALSPAEVALRDELRASVQMISSEIGERNMVHYSELNAAADFIENSFSRAGLQSRRDSYELDGLACHISKQRFSVHRHASLLSALITTLSLALRAQMTMAAESPPSSLWRGALPQDRHHARCVSWRS
jgi:hypothetical protein